MDTSNPMWPEKMGAAIHQQTVAKRRAEGAMASETNDVQRYDLAHVTRCGEAWREMHRNSEGDWVEYEEHAKAIAAAREAGTRDGAEQAVRDAAPFFVQLFREHWVNTGTAIRTEDASRVADDVVARMGLAAREGK